MEITEAIRTALKELIVPELDRIKEENTEIKAILSLTNKRLDDVTAHLVDQSRRIDTLREEFTRRTDTLQEGFTKRTDTLQEEFNRRTDTLRLEFAKSIEGVRTELALKFGEIATRMDRLYEVIVRRDEYISVEERVAALERDVNELKRRIAA